MLYYYILHNKNMSEVSTMKYFKNINTGIDNIQFELTGVDTSLANSIRRSLLSEIPIYGLEDEPEKTFSHYLDAGLELPPAIKILENTSSLHNEFLSHRVGLIPIYCTRPVETYFDETLMMRIYKPFVNTVKIKELEDKLIEIDELTNTEEFNSIKNERDFVLSPPEFVLHVKNTKKTRDEIENKREDDKIDVTADMFKILNKDIDTSHYIRPDPVIHHEFKEKSYPLIIRLKPNSETGADGQGVYIKATPTVGIARHHSKYCPVGTVTYEFKRDDDPVRIRTVFTRMMENINKNRIMKKVKPIDLSSMFDVEHNMVSTNSEIMKYWSSFDILDRDKIYLHEDGEPTIYQFCVESIGSMTPENCVYHAINMLKIKMMDIYTHIDSDYVNFDKANSVMDAIDVHITNENHTVGNLIANYLKFDKKVVFATYKMPHPLEERIVIRVQLKKSKSSLTYKERVISVFKDCLNKIISLMDELMSEWKSVNSIIDDYIIDDVTNQYLETKKIKASESTDTKKKRRKVKLV